MPHAQDCGISAVTFVSFACFDMSVTMRTRIKVDTDTRLHTAENLLCVDVSVTVVLERTASPFTGRREVHDYVSSCN